MGSEKYGAFGSEDKVPVRGASCGLDLEDP